ncbi:MAG: UvrD-helicase domain-containing protein [Actinomycetota bacterium]|nr:UvrD-helicase domain-containing protein [Actinomycetota bacterium]
MTASTRRPSAEQVAAIEEPGVVFVSAGAGTGKTTVLVERFVKAVCARGLSLESVLVITYTERAAGELRARIRERLVELGRGDLTREIDRAWISTIHGFCSRLLRNHPFEAGLDPRFRVLDESQARVLRAEAFETALAAFCADRRPDRLALLSTYGARRLGSMLTGVFERLRSAGRPLELGPSAGGGIGDAIAALEEATRAALAHGRDPDGRARGLRALELIAPVPAPERLLDLSDLRVSGEGSEAFAGYNEALSALESTALEEIAARDRDLLQELLRTFAGAYRAAKARESAVDFEDLQLLARDLLATNEQVRERTRWRFRSIMIDEFQDTNRLQCELIDLLSDGEGARARVAPTTADVFYVGDEFQSIYRFRHADVAVFRERRADTSEVLALRENYRSRPELLSFVNHVFGTEFGIDFEPLVAAGRFPEPLFGPAVELLVTDKSSYRGGELHWRAAEARRLAGRIRDLVDAGECTPGDVVLLFAAGTDAERYEEALRAEGLPTYRAAGRGYFGQQQVADLVAYLRLLQNRYDDEALVTVLASPFVGVSNDALVLLRRATRRRPLFSGLERELPAGLGSRDRRLFEAFRQRYERLAALVPTVGLERLCERMVVEHDYDLAVLARWDGRRRYANVRKLARLARSYEELRGPDVDGFVRFLREQEAAGAKEVEASAEEEAGDAVRLLTVHAAKGLEFKVVVLADAGRTPPPPSADEILCLPDGRFAFRVVNPVTGRRASAFGYDAVREEERAAEQAENRRLLYVAMTRAIDRLIVSGSVDTSVRRDVSAPLRWILDRLAVGLDDAPTDTPVELDRGGTHVLLRVDRAGAGGEERPASAESQLELFPAGGGGGAVREALALAPLVPVPEPPSQPIRRLSYTALALFERCSYRFYAERIAGLAPRDGAGVLPAGDGLAATELGEAVHDVLELGAAGDEARDRVGARYPGASEDDLRRVEALVEAWRASPLARTLEGDAEIRSELPFVFEHEDVLLHGRFDLFRLVEGRALVVDYKTNRLEGASPADVAEEEYSLQRLVYALAALRAGADEVEVAYVFLECPEEVVATTFSRRDARELEEGLSAAIARIRAGDFRPTPSEFVCHRCPALDLVCAGPRLRSSPPAAAMLAP